MFAKGLLNGGMPAYAPTPSFDGPAIVPEPTILQEIARIHADAADLASGAITRTIKLRERLVGNVVSPDVAQLQEGLRWPPEGDLGRTYHQAFQLREALNRLHYELGQLENI